MVNPANVHEDSAGRGTWWAVASTTLGAALHEMGHAFGLPHCYEPRCIMTRGFDHLNRFFTFTEEMPGRTPVTFPADREAWFAPVSASFLRWSPWFQPDPPRNSPGGGPEIVFDERKQEVEFSSRAGLRCAGFYEKSDIRGFREFRGNAPKKIKMTLGEIGKLMENHPLSKVTVIDEAGRTASLEIKP